MTRFIFVCVFIAFSCQSHAQLALDSVLNSLIISKCDSNNIKPLSQALASMLPYKTIYLKGELYSMRANENSLNSLFFGLHAKKNVNYILLEYNHSMAFSYNLFLRTGDLRIFSELYGDTILDNLSLKQKYGGLLALYNYNINQTKENKISFIGIDVDLHNAWLRRDVQDHYKFAIRNFKKHALKEIPVEVLILFDKILLATNLRILKDLDYRLREVSEMHTNELRACFGEFYKDYNIIIHSVKGFASTSRDKDLLSNFVTAINAIKDSYPTETPKFFGSFGTSHVEPDVNTSFGSLLNKSKKFKGQVSFIASGYYNSLSHYDELKPIMWQGFPIFGLSAKDQIIANDLVKEVAKSTKKSMILMGGFRNLTKGRLDFLKSYDALLIYNSFYKEVL